MSGTNMSGPYGAPIYGWTCASCNVFVPWYSTHEHLFSRMPNITGAGHEVAASADLEPERVIAFAKALFKEVPTCTGCDFDHGWDDHVLAVWRSAAILNRDTGSAEPEPEYTYDASCPHCRAGTPHHPIEAATEPTPETKEGNPNVR